MTGAQSLLPLGKFEKLENGHTLHYLEYGAGEPIVLLHGSGIGASGYSNFKSNYQCLVDDGFRVIIIDHLGYGFSDKPRGVAYTLDLFVECTRQLLRRIGVGPCTMVGNSLGGAIALGYALAYPGSVSGLILMAPGGIEEKADYFAMEGHVAMRAAFEAGTALTASRMKVLLQNELVYDAAVMTDELIAERMEVQQLQNDQVIVSMVIPNMTARLAEIRCPVLVLWGLQERLMPMTGIDKLARGCANARVVLVPRCGHWVMLEHRDLFNRMVLDFLRHDLPSAA